MCVDTCLTYQSLVPQSDWPFHALTNNNRQKKRLVSVLRQTRKARSKFRLSARRRAWFSIVLLCFLPRFIHLGWVVLSLHLIHPITIRRGSEKKENQSTTPYHQKPHYKEEAAIFLSLFFLVGSFTESFFHVDVVVEQYHLLCCAKEPTG